VLLLAVWAAGGSLARQPHDLMYFNEWVGGPENGWHYSVIGDDWGQDTAGLGCWMEAHDVDFMYYDYYGTGDPSLWGVVSRPTFADPRAFEPIEGLVAVHVSLLARVPDNYRWLEGLEPIDHVGHGILIYDVGSATRVDALFDTMHQPLPVEVDPDAPEGG
jgi:hypothetical protein